MVLVLNGVLQTKSPQDTQSLYNSHPIYRETAAQLLAIPEKIVGPEGLLHVLQREMAATTPFDKNVTILGSGDVTTCIIIVVRHSGSGAVALAHVDGSGVEEGIYAMIQKVQELAIGYQEGRLEVQLVGGYSNHMNPQNYSEKLFYDIMHVLQKHPVELDLTLACVGDLNTTTRNGVQYPIIYGIGVIVKTGEIFPASFPEKGPEEFLRTTRLISTSGNREILDVYDCNLGLLKIGPFNYKPIRGADLWLEQDDEFILKLLSTSPVAETPHFVPNIRGTLKYIQENPFPAVTVFRDNRPHYFRRDENTGLWVPVY